VGCFLTERNLARVADQRGQGGADEDGTLRFHSQRLTGGARLSGEDGGENTKKKVGIGSLQDLNSGPDDGR
jgi:hypothetical protein